MADNVDIRFLGEKMHEVQSDLRQVRAEPLRQESGQVQMQDRLSTLERKVDAGFEQVDARLEQVDTRFGQVDARFGQVDARLDSIDARLNQVVDALTTNTKVILDAIRNRFGA